jgi:hypothetical protein
MKTMRAVLAGAAIAAAVAVPTTLARARAEDHDSAAVIQSALPTSSPSLAPLPTASAFPAPPPTSSAGPSGWEVVASYNFDDGFDRAGTIFDDSGHGHTLRLASRHGGALRTELRGGGLALTYPRPCRKVSRRLAGAPPACPRVVLQASTSDELNPGTRPFAWGAMIKLPANATGPGENVIQKGFRARTGQFKLQVDGTAGHPSCVMTETRTRAFHEVYARVSIADGRWHRVDCLRDRTRLTIVVDRGISAETRIPAGLMVSNDMPLRIGGKGVLTGNDQFNGAIDDVYVALG